MQDNDKYILQSVDNSLIVLELFAENKELGVSEVAELMNMGKSTAFRILTTLENRHYLHKQKNSKYCLGLKLFSLGHIVKNDILIKDFTYSYLTRLTNQTGETSHLVMWYDKNKVIFVEKVLSKASIRMDSFVGFTMNAHITASGKTLLAALSDDRIREYTDYMIFEPKTPNTIVTAAALIEEIRKIRENGYAIDNEENERGLICYAAAVYDSMGEAFGAISISGPTERMTENRDKNIQCLKMIAQEISNSL